ncbi:50S ribosomal protein L11 methyltransferase [Arcobacter sp.]|uniref:50S ribosomal protein L11 methyltransferase n=1 Tax=Arcobacter sp. TaxID=1872629 RepID=UPI003D0AFA1A
MEEYYYELVIDTKDSQDLFLDLLNQLTQNAVEIEENRLIARSEDNLEDVEYGIKEFAKALGLSCTTSIEKKKNEDWIKKYQESVKAVEVGKFFIRPSWVEEKDGKIDIIINPALSFGSGHHETTNSCLEAISKYVKENDEVIDVGCGSGILSIAASKLGAKVDICDTDDVCIESSKSNFILNNANFSNAWVGSAMASNKEYDFVIANIVADVLVMIAKELKKCLKDGGTLVLSGILDKHLNKVLKKFDDLNQIEVIQKNDWVTLVLKKGV